MNCIIVDDNKMARAAIKQLIEQVDFLNLTHECSSPVEAFNYLKKETADLIFLDVEMPEMTGIELVKNLENPPLVILITAKKEYAVEAFDLKVVDYLTKPVSLPRFLIATARAKELFDQKDRKADVVEKDKDFIFVRSNSLLTKIKVNDIIYIQALGDYVNIFTPSKRHTVHTTLRSISEKLSSEKFFRLHRCYLVNLDHIDNIEENIAYVVKHPIPIGAPLKKELLAKLNLI